MKAFQITELKNFMSRLLGTDTFDSFLLAEASISTYNSFVIDGHIEQEFFAGNDETDEHPAYEFSEWKSMRSLCFDLIKGKRTPLNFKFILHLKPEFVSDILQTGDSAVTLSDVRAFVLNIKYDGSQLSCITATAFHTFIMDKTPDQLWDAYMTDFFEKAGIHVDLL